MTSVTKKLVLVLIPVLVLMMALLGVLLFLPGNNGGVYLEQISHARKLAESGDYQNAIVYFKNAISEDGTQEDPYIELANIYFQLNMHDEGIKVLREGYQHTNSMKIIELLNTYEPQETGAAGENTEKLGAAETVSINSNYISIFSSFNYEKYTSEYTVKNEQITADTYSVVYVQFDAAFDYTNSADNAVLDTSSGKPYRYARPTAIRLNQLSQLITGVKSGVTTEDLKTCGAAGIRVLPFDKNIGANLVTFEYGGMTITLGCDEQGTVKGDNAYNVLIPKRGQASSQKVMTTGKIIDATSGSAVSGVTLKFHVGKNNQNGDVAATAENINGEYSVELDVGEYTVEIIADGYNKEYLDLYVSDNGAENDQTISLSPTLAANEIRFVLEWGATPVDVDSHLEGTCRTGGSTRVDVNWMHEKAISESKTIAELDLDDRNGYGPETITLYDTNGSFEYKVHRYSSDGDLASSGATVKIYTANSSTPIVVTVPAGVDREWWTVCRIENGEIKDINGVIG